MQLGRAIQIRDTDDKLTGRNKTYATTSCEFRSSKILVVIITKSFFMLAVQ